MTKTVHKTLPGGGEVKEVGGGRVGLEGVKGWGRSRGSGVGVGSGGIKGWG